MPGGEDFENGDELQGAIAVAEASLEMRRAAETIESLRFSNCQVMGEQGSRRLGLFIHRVGLLMGCNRVLAGPYVYLMYPLRVPAVFQFFSLF